MPRRVSRRRLATATVLVALAILPNVVHVYGAMFYPHVGTKVAPVVYVMVLDRELYYFDAASAETARRAGYRWEQYRRWSWILAAVAACIVVREFLPIPRVFGRDDGEYCD